MPPKKKSRTDQDATENVCWTNDEVELLLGQVSSYSPQKYYEELEWESVKSKYEGIDKNMEKRQFQI